ncbi:MAG: hypothetical protein IT288_16385 [Bdellovibrionales bacterium]|nr:hypothetical protein [Bdellovibrionales bacterium]
MQKVLCFLACLALAQSALAGNRGLNGTNCNANVKISMAYEPYDDEGNVDSSFANCPTTVNFDYGALNNINECTATIGDANAHIFFGFDVLNLPPDVDHPQTYKSVSAWWYVAVRDANGGYSNDNAGSVVEVEPNVNFFGFPGWVTPERMNDPVGRVQYQFRFRAFLEDQGCLNP